MQRLSLHKSCKMLSWWVIFIIRHHPITHQLHVSVLMYYMNFTQVEIQYTDCTSQRITELQITVQKHLHIDFGLLDGRWQKHPWASAENWITDSLCLALSFPTIILCCCCLCCWAPPFCRCSAEMSVHHCNVWVGVCALVCFHFFFFSAWDQL